MKKVYFLINALIAFLLPNFVPVIIQDNNFFYEDINTDNINIDVSKYLKLSYQDGNFYSWNQTNDSKQHIIGIFTNNEQSYLLDNLGVFWSLNYQILNFYRVNDKIGIAQIVYFQNENKEEYFNQSFFVRLENNKIIINSTPIFSENPYFAVLTQNDAKYVVAYGLGLDLIEVDSQDVKTLIPAYDKGHFMTSFYRINDNNGIFVAGDQYFYLLKDITGTLTQVKINLKASSQNTNNIVVINDKNLVIRDEKNILYFVTLNQEIVINSWKKISIARNIAFVLNQDTFILNISSENSGFEYGLSYLVKINDWKNLISIPNIKTISDFIFIKDNKGIFIDKNLVANIFTYQSSNDSFTFSKIGTLHCFQFVNQNLIFGSVQNHNLLITQEVNQSWAVSKSVQFTSSSYGNLLNTVISTKEKDINYQNTYFSDSYVSLNIFDKKLVKVDVKSKSGTKILKPKKDNISYTFFDFDDYQVTVSFDNGVSLDYYVKIRQFANQELVNILAESNGKSNIISYVGSAKSNLENELYDIKSVDQNDIFVVNKYDYDYLQYVQLFVYDDTKNMVVKNVFNLSENSVVKANKKDKNFFFGLKMVNLLNQISWIYLGFSQKGVQPMINFWNTDFGKHLMEKALARRYLETDLKAMNSQQIQKLIQISNGWQAIEIQGKSIVIVIISIFFFALVAIIISLAYNTFLNKKIAIEEIEKNKSLKNPLDL